jgi:NAD(P)-dependent dehydrogenase (short-subunit alcohol dehydrogenase family)
MRLKEKAALITGAGGGIGEATAFLFAQEGAKVGVQDVNVEAAEKVAAAINDKGGKAVAIAGDVTKKANCETMVQSVVSEYGKIDILINNAGINKDALTRKMTEEQWDDVLRVNLKGTFLMCQAAYEPMSQASYGRIVNTASIGALGNVGQANYSASKAGVMGLTRTLALEFAKARINVNCVAPGATETKMTAGIPEDVRKFIENKIPFRRFAKPEEIAQAHLFFAGDEASYVTGQTLFVDGGISVGI